MKHKVRIFDLDDTLIAITHDYAGPIAEASLLIIEQLGSKAPHITKILNLEQEIDHRRIQEINPLTARPFLYSMERFPGSLIQTYKQICQQMDIQPEQDTEAELYSIGLKAFDPKRYKKNIRPCVHETINFLRFMSDSIHLVTKGDQRVQERKIEALKESGITFDSISIVDNDKTETFLKIASAYPDSVFYSIGDSYLSDIKPIIENDRFKGILFKVESWENMDKLEQILEEIDYEKCQVIENLREIIDLYEIF